MALQGRATFFVLSGMASFALGPAHAALTMSTAPTQGVMCVAGSCRTVTADATLNVDDVAALLSTGDVSVVSGAQTSDIVIAKPLKWSSKHVLTLDAAHSILIEQPMTVAGPGQLRLRTNDGQTGGTLSFIAGGSLRIPKPAESALTINGQAYTLVHSVQELAAAVTAHPAGMLALANAYDAKKDGIYTASPVTTAFSGVFDGLGNTIANLTVASSASGSAAENPMVGLFSSVAGTVQNLTLRAANVQGASYAFVGALAGQAAGARLLHDRVAGLVFGGDASVVGGLAGVVYGGIIANCSSAAAVSSPGGDAGGLVGSVLNGTVMQSYATGPVQGSDAGGLVADMALFALVVNSYATGAVSGSDPSSSTVGGLVGSLGYGDGAINSSYSVGRVRMGAPTLTGGLVGYFAMPFAGAPHNASLENTYWDAATSGQGDAAGSGTPLDATGLTTSQLQSGLPSGFSATIWTQDAARDGGYIPPVNRGFPILLAAPPP